MKKSIAKTASVLFWIVAWYILSRIIAKPLLLPGPVAVITRLFVLFTQGSFWLTLLSSMLRVVLGTASAVLLGILLAVCTSASKVCAALFEPFLHIIKATPVASFIILILLWLDRNIVPAVVSALIVLPAVHSNVAKGITETDKKLLEMAKVFRVSRSKFIRHIYIPGTLPYFESSLRTSLGMGWKAGIAAEVLTVPAYSIGKMIMESKLYVETTDLFAWTLAVILLSTAIEITVMHFTEKRGVADASSR